MKFAFCKGKAWVIVLVCVNACFFCGCLKADPDEVARKKVEDALKADQRLAVEQLNITVENLVAKVSGEVGSELHPQIINEILEKLKSEGIIKDYRNEVTVIDVENPLFQDYTVPYF